MKSKANKIPNVKGLINKLTRADQPLNMSFDWYGDVQVDAQSGTSNYQDVTIRRKRADGWSDCLAEFAVDYMTREVDWADYSSEGNRDAVENAFKELYGCKFFKFNDCEEQ